MERFVSGSVIIFEIRTASEMCALDLATAKNAKTNLFQAFISGSLGFCPL